MRNRYHDRYSDRYSDRFSDHFPAHFSDRVPERPPEYDEPNPARPYDYGFRRRHGSPRPRRAAPPYAWSDRLAFDAGDPASPRHGQRWRRYLDEFGRMRHRVRRRWEGEEREMEAGVGRGRRIARRYKEPIVGAALAGAALPLAVGAAGGQRAPEEVPEPQPIGERVMEGRPTPRGELEEEVGHRLASLRNARIREATIDGAMTAYGITRALAEQIHDIAVSHNIEPELAFGLVKTESAFDHRAISHVGARGLTQVMPRTARWLRPGTTTEDLYNRRLNLNLGFGYLRDLIDKYDGNVRLALLAYNRGPGTVDRVLSRGGDPDNGYADLVLEGYTDLG